MDISVLDIVHLIIMLISAAQCAVLACTTDIGHGLKLRVLVAIFASTPFALWVYDLQSTQYNATWIDIAKNVCIIGLVYIIQTKLGSVRATSLGAARNAPRRAPTPSPHPPKP